MKDYDRPDPFKATPRERQLAQFRERTGITLAQHARNLKMTRQGTQDFESSDFRYHNLRRLTVYLNNLGYTVALRIEDRNVKGSSQFIRLDCSKPETPPETLKRLNDERDKRTRKRLAKAKKLPAK